MDVIDLSQGDLDFTKIESLDDLNQALQPFIDNHREFYSQILAYLKPHGEEKFAGILTYYSVMGEKQIQHVMGFLADKMPEPMEKLKTLIENIRVSLNNVIGENDLIVMAKSKEAAKEAVNWMNQLAFEGLGIKKALNIFITGSEKPVSPPKESRRKKRIEKPQQYILPFNYHFADQGDPEILKRNVATWFENSGYTLPVEYRAAFEYLSHLGVRLLGNIRSSEDINTLYREGEQWLSMMDFMYELGMCIETDIQRPILENLPAGKLFEGKMPVIPEYLKATIWSDITFGISGEITAHAIAEGLLRAAKIDGDPLLKEDRESARVKLMEAEGWSSFKVSRIQPKRRIIVEWLGETCPKLLAPLNEPKVGIRLKNGKITLI